MLRHQPAVINLPKSVTQVGKLDQQKPIPHCGRLNGFPFNNGGACYGDQCHSQMQQVNMFHKGVIDQRDEDRGEYGEQRDFVSLECSEGGQVGDVHHPKLHQSGERQFDSGFCLNFLPLDEWKKNQRGNEQARESHEVRVNPCQVAFN